MFSRCIFYRFQVLGCCSEKGPTLLPSNCRVWIVNNYSVEKKCTLGRSGGHGAGGEAASPEEIAPPPGNPAREPRSPTAIR